MPTGQRIDETQYSNFLWQVFIIRVKILVASDLFFLKQIFFFYFKKPFKDIWCSENVLLIYHYDHETIGFLAELAYGSVKDMKDIYGSY